MRCCVSWYETTNGVSCYELIFRCCCLLCCIRFSDTFPKDEESEYAEGSGARGPLYWILCCCLCPRCCWNAIKGGSRTDNDVGEDAGGDEDEEELDEDGDEDGGEDGEEEERNE